ncbi:reticulon-like protein B21 [Telopea speciosissima]|uniref:reticulon-like protein B21 n=1 Tax=Telopea speciosissima TaxID=54955 RepID=UPI001CC6E115|nr:reticulon-like protein B21 [Telopea speciosissima]
MDVIRRRAAARNSVVAGSVWEIRMKCDEVKGGIKVFNGEENFEEGGGDDKGLQFYTPLKRNQIGGTTARRKTWNDRTPFQIRKTRLELKKFSDESCKELNMSVDSIEENQIQMRKTRSETHRVSDECCKGLDMSVGFNSPRRLWMDDDGIDADGEEEGEDEEDDLEIEVEKKTYDDKEVNLAEQKKSIDISEQKLKEIEEEIKKVHQIPRKPIPISANVKKELSPVINPPAFDLTKAKKVVNEEKKVRQMREKPKHVFSRVNKQQTSVRFPPLIDPSLRKAPPIADSKVFDRIPETPNKLQNIVDLVMWRDISKSAFAFGVGSFFLFLSSFTTEFNFSLISAISYMGLVYLAALFLYKSILCRGIAVDKSNQDYIVGEEEAILLLRRILPYLNEFLLTLKGLFSGDPASTMKVAVLLFILARYGSSITMWEMAKLGFFAVFTVPKVCSSYSSQLIALGKFWIRRIRDAWHSCPHKKAVAAAVFILKWNFSSVVVRIWGVFMLFVAVRYYQESLLTKDCGDEEMREGEDSSWREGECVGQR